MKGMRYESADVADVDRYITDPAWVLEQKLDGIRMIAAIDDQGQVRCYSHTGEQLRTMARQTGPIVAALTGSGLRSVTVDGELLESGHYWLFDVLVAVGTDVRLLPLTDRRRMLELVAPAVEGPLVHVVPQATTSDAKAALWDQVVATSAEGVVAKRVTARYETGRRTRDVLKIKITRTIDVAVIATGEKGHNSATLALYQDGRPVPVGKCSLIGKAPVAPGDVIEVTFLYVVDPAAPRLYQARMMRPRPDRTPESCELAQLDGCFASRQVVV